jgi:hypothetical protein
VSHGRQHIVDVSIPEMAAVAVMALAEGNLAGAVSAVGERVTVIVTFGDGSAYKYPEVPAIIALSVKSDPEGQFQNIRFWPGYRRLR